MRQSRRSPCSALPRSSAGFLPERLEEKNITAWEQQRTDQKPTGCGGMAGSDCGGDWGSERSEGRSSIIQLFARPESDDVRSALYWEEIGLHTEYLTAFLPRSTR